VAMKARRWDFGAFCDGRRSDPPETDATETEPMEMDAAETEPTEADAAESD